MQDGGEARAADAEGLLADKVKNGGAGTWGAIPMVPNPQVPDLYPSRAAAVDTSGQ
jgi:cytochrome c551/c552